MMDDVLSIRRPAVSNASVPENITVPFAQLVRCRSVLQLPFLYFLFLFRITFPLSLVSMLCYCILSPFSTVTPHTWFQKYIFFVHFVTSRHKNFADCSSFPFCSKKLLPSASDLLYCAKQLKICINSGTQSPNRKSGRSTASTCMISIYLFGHSLYQVSCSLDISSSWTIREMKSYHSFRLNIWARPSASKLFEQRCGLRKFAICE